MVLSNVTERNDLITMATMPFIYRIRNLSNNKTYIGATRLTPQQRFARHLTRARNGAQSKLCSAIRKWGPTNFCVEAVQEYKTFAETLAAEREFISAEKPPYNMTAGGEGILDYKMSDVAREKMSAAKLGRPAAWVNGPEHEAICAKLKVTAKTRVQHPFTEERRAKHAATLKKVTDARRKSVIRVDTGEIFPSVNAAAVATGIARTTIMRGGSLRGERIAFILVGGDPTNVRVLKAYTEEEKERRRQRLEVLREKRRKKVLCVTTGVIYPSLKAAHLATGISIPSILQGGIRRSRVVEFRILNESSV